MKPSPLPKKKVSVMTTDADVDVQHVTGFQFEEPCGSTFPCDNPATFAVWVDHHKQGCDYSGYRCDVHRNLLELETRREIEAIKAGQVVRCALCFIRVTGTNMSDHFRWIRL